jgi:PKHD-type hydroxylase
MMLHVPEVLDADAIEKMRALLDRASWEHGRITAGTQSEQVKNNRQLAENSEAAKEGRTIVLDALARNAVFFSAVLPKKIFPPLFNRYDGATNSFGNHVDNAVRTLRGTNLHVRTDVSATLFLSDPDQYDGGELVVEDTFGTRAVKLPAGDLLLYPSSSVHRVEPVTRGSRIASFFWIESMVRRDEQRSLLFDLDLSVLALRRQLGESEPVVRLTGCYHNLMRMWADL